MRQNLTSELSSWSCKNLTVGFTSRSFIAVVKYTTLLAAAVDEIEIEMARQKRAAGHITVISVGPMTRSPISESTFVLDKSCLQPQPWPWCGECSRWGPPFRTPTLRRPYSRELASCPTSPQSEIHVFASLWRLAVNHCYYWCWENHVSAMLDFRKFFFFSLTEHQFLIWKKQDFGACPILSERDIQVLGMLQLKNTPINT